MKHRARTCPHCGGRPLLNRVTKMHSVLPTRWMVFCSNCIRYTDPHLFAFKAVREWNKADDLMWGDRRGTQDD